MILLYNAIFRSELYFVYSLTFKGNFFMAIRFVHCENKSNHHFGLIKL